MKLNVQLICGRSDSFVWIDLTPRDVSRHHVTGQSIHPCEFPKNANYGLTRVEPLALKEVTQTGTEFMFLKSQDGVEEH